MRRAALSLLFVLACAGDPPASIAPRTGGTGPMVVWDSLHKPDPEIPFPNDAATILDPSSPTGRRLNLSVDVPVASERRFRENVDQLDGFSVWGAISVSFDAPLNLATVSDATVRVVDITPGSPEFGQSVPLDLGRGGVPQSFQPRALYTYDPLADRSDLLFDDDNVVDGVRVEHWEVATNTLLIRPLLPLRQRTRYAVVLGTGLEGRDGQSVRSPFPGVNHAAQTDALSAVPLGDVAFAWTFTTQSVTAPLESVRDGLDGKGPLAGLANYPTRFKTITDVGFEPLGNPDGAKDRYSLDPKRLQDVLEPFGFAGFGVENAAFDHVAYFVYGKLEAPDLRGDGGPFPSGEVQPAEVPFALAVPKTTAQFKPPFPVLLYNHGARTSRFEMMLVANEVAQHGIAVISIDAAGHGPFPGDLVPILEVQAADYPPDLIIVVAQLIAQTVLGADYSADGKTLANIFTDLETNGLFRTFFVEGRATDDDGDGVLYSGDSYFVADPFKIAAASQQTITDNLGLLRLLRRLGPVPQGASVEARRLAGDFNGDGVVDIGGPDNKYFAAGTSLGGIHTSVLLGVEPSFVAGVPIVSGGGLTDILVRTTLDTAVRPVLAEVTGPVLVGCPHGAEVSLSWDFHANGCDTDAFIEKAEVARAELAPGGTVTLENPRLVALGVGEARAQHPIASDGGFGIAVAADKDDPLTLTVRDAVGNVVGQPLVLPALHDGMGRVRNTPRLRRLLQVAQIGLDRGDPIAWARHLIREPLGGRKVNVLHLTDVGDKTVPFASMVAWDRAVGLHGLTWPAAGALTQELVDRDVLANPGGWDIDDLDGSGDGYGLLPAIDTGHGKSAVRHAPISRHEFIGVTDPDAAFDWGPYFRRMLAWYLATDGQEIVDDPCFEDGSCAWLP